MGQREPHFLSDPMSDRKKKFSPTLRNIYKKQHGARPCVEKMKVKGYMYPQMKKPVGMLPPFKMAAVTKNRNFFNCPLLL